MPHPHLEQLVPVRPQPPAGSAKPRTNAPMECRHTAWKSVSRIIGQNPGPSGTGRAASSPEASPWQSEWKAKTQSSSVREAWMPPASRVAAMPGVRAALLARQRAFAEPPGLVADGRDMGTVVFPAAELKIFLTASAGERARRRYNQLNNQLKGKGPSANLAALSLEIAERDRRDANRPIAPLRPADDAVIVDSTSMSIEAVVARVLELAAKIGKK